MLSIALVFIIIYVQLQSVRALISDFKDATFTYKAAHVFFTDCKLKAFVNTKRLIKS